MHYNYRKNYIMIMLLISGMQHAYAATLDVTLSELAGGSRSIFLQFSHINLASKAVEFNEGNSLLFISSPATPGNFFPPDPIRLHEDTTANSWTAGPQPIGAFLSLQVSALNFQYLGTDYTFQITNTLTLPTVAVFVEANGVNRVDYLINSVYTPTVVPIPAAMWLMGSGLLGIMGFARRNQKIDDDVVRQCCQRLT